MTTPSMHNSKIGGFISLLTHNPWNLEALAFLKLSLNHYIAISDANSRSFILVNGCKTVVISIINCLT